MLITVVSGCMLRKLTTKNDASSFLLSLMHLVLLSPFPVITSRGMKQTRGLVVSLSPDGLPKIVDNAAVSISCLVSSHFTNVAYTYSLCGDCLVDVEYSRSLESTTGI